MKRFNIGENVKIQRYDSYENLLCNGKVIDTKYIGIFKKYGIEYSYEVEKDIHEESEDSLRTINKVEWFSPYDIFKDGTVD